MSFEQILTGTVIRYPYLWAREAHSGETEGRKERPVAVGVRISRPDGDLILLFPIITKEPGSARFSAELPAIEKKRAGLDPTLRLWLVLDEFNTDVVGRSLRRATNSLRSGKKKALLNRPIGETGSR